MCLKPRVYRLVAGIFPYFRSCQLLERLSNGYSTTSCEWVPGSNEDQLDCSFL
jgi:hypothetical protein